MSWWQRFVALFNRDRGFLVRGGHELRWPRAALITVTCADSLGAGWWPYIAGALSQLEAAAGRPLFLGPVETIGALESVWQDPLRRRGLTLSVHVQGGPVPDSHGTSDIDFDERTGEIRSVLVTLPVVPPSWAAEMALHELGHALGLDHDEAPASIMAPTLRLWAHPVLGPEDARRLRGAYGP